MKRASFPIYHDVMVWLDDSSAALTVFKFPDFLRKTNLF